MALTLEAARVEDLARALALLEAASLPIEGVREALGGFLVAREGGRIVGLAGLESYGPHGLLRSLVVDPEFQASGVGRRLVDAIVERARAQGLDDIYLLTTTARDYFLRRGFMECSRDAVPEPLRESWEFKTGCPTTSACMWRVVARPPLG